MSPIFTLHIMSDGTGETASALVKAVLVQYKPEQVNIICDQNIRTKDQTLASLEKIKSGESALLVHTIVLPELRALIKKTCLNKNIKVFDLFDFFFKNLDGVLQNNPGGKKPGLLRNVDKNYFKRIAATDFSLRHDDGKQVEKLKDADIILVGVSRTSKTPLSIYLSFKGWKVANVPLVLGIPLPKNLDKIDYRKIIGLTINIDNLIRIRKNRLKKFGWNFNREYADKAHILKEMMYSTEIFNKHRWPVVDVTDRALEETAGEITRIMRVRTGVSKDDLF